MNGFVFTRILAIIALVVLIVSTPLESEEFKYNEVVFNVEKPAAAVTSPGQQPETSPGTTPGGETQPAPGDDAAPKQTAPGKLAMSVNYNVFCANLPLKISFDFSKVGDKPDVRALGIYNENNQIVYSANKNKQQLEILKKGKGTVTLPANTLKPDPAKDFSKFSIIAIVNGKLDASSKVSLQVMPSQSPGCVVQPYQQVITLSNRGFEKEGSLKVGIIFPLWEIGGTPTGKGDNGRAFALKDWRNSQKLQTFNFIWLNADEQKATAKIRVEAVFSGNKQNEALTGATCFNSKSYNQILTKFNNDLAVSRSITGAVGAYIVLAVGSIILAPYVIPAGIITIGSVAISTKLFVGTTLLAGSLSIPNAWASVSEWISAEAKWNKYEKEVESQSKKEFDIGPSEELCCWSRKAGNSYKLHTEKGSYDAFPWLFCAKNLVSSDEGVIKQSDGTLQRSFKFTFYPGKPSDPFGLKK